MTKEILGIVNGKCSYTEEMPNNGRMNCNYTEDLRKAAAQYYESLTNAESFGGHISSNLVDKPTTTYTINGKQVDNPVQEALDSGQCVIVGY